MAEKRSSRRIDVRHLNVGIYLTLGVIVLIYAPELGWAVRALPVYLRGDIPGPVERAMYQQAAKLPAAEAIPLLRRSIEIDPNTEAVLILAKKLEEAGQPEEAREHYERYIQIDPYAREAYVELAALLEKQGKREQAMHVLEQGARHFRSNFERFRPHEDPAAEARENDKARRVYAEYRESAQQLEAAVKRLRAR